MARQRVPEGPPPPPPVQRIRLRYAKRGRLRFSSTRDFQRALERALRRAGVPMAFSAGFHPHPRISYANAAPTGSASEAEYVEIALAELVDPSQLRVDVDRALPDGLDILDAVQVRSGSLSDRLEASEWQLDFRGVGVSDLAHACQTLLSTEKCDVTRVFKSGPRTFDARAAVCAMDVGGDPSGQCVILRMVVRHTTPSVRPDDILTALRQCANFVPPTPPRVTRMAQGPLVSTNHVADPLVADRDVVGT